MASEKLKRRIIHKSTDGMLYRASTVTNRYGGEKLEYVDSGVMLRANYQPMSSELDIAEYGERVAEMLQAYIYADGIELSENDRIKLGDTFYNIVSIKPYASYRLIVIERVN